MFHIKVPDLQKTRSSPPEHWSSNKERKNSPTCYYCHKTGHLIVDCWTQKNRETKGANDRKPEGLVTANKCFPKDNQRPRREIIREEYRLFVSEGYISLAGNPEREISVKVLRDTGATQFLILRDYIP